MRHVVHTAGCSIYCGDEIASAAERSRIVNSAFRSKPKSRFEVISQISTDMQNAKYRELLPRSCTVSGSEKDSGKTLTVRVAGTLRVLSFCAKAIFGNDSFQEASSDHPGIGSPDILVSDHPFSHPLLRRRGSFRVPTWVRQQLPIRDSWAETVSCIPPRLRKEISRMLRRYAYSVKISSGPATIRDYYRQLHVPYLTHRFGSDAFLPSEAAFMDQSRYMTRLDLIHRDFVVAASLLESQRSQLAIRASSMQPDAYDLHGRSDALDYFSLLIGQLLGHRFLDFGLSRPHLENGPFRYKAKWRSSVINSGRFKADICIAPLRRTEAVLAFLRRNYFLQRNGDGFIVRLLHDEHATRSGLDQFAALRDKNGLDGICLAYDPAEMQPLPIETPGLSFDPICRPGDPLNIVLVHQ